jgi:hypothetical protein
MQLGAGGSGPRRLAGGAEPVRPALLVAPALLPALRQRVGRAPLRRLVEPLRGFGFAFELFMGSKGGGRQGDHAHPIYGTQKTKMPRLANRLFG